MIEGLLCPESTAGLARGANSHKGTHKNDAHVSRNPGAPQEGIGCLQNSGARAGEKGASGLSCSLAKPQGHMVLVLWWLLGPRKW